ncbi:MAG TPA: glucoamylase family protein [Thermoanaerobaculia bacterium]|nr:glucoamylase family protein [Thermoanaerobaculia bacterium]
MAVPRTIHLVLACLLVAACAATPADRALADRTPVPQPQPSATGDHDDFLDDLQRRTFDYFWETTEPATGLAPDRWPSRPFASIAAIGFALTAYAVGVERGWVEREEARDRTIDTLRFFWNAPQGAATTEVTGYRGFFYHFLDLDTGHRHGTTELSTIDTALLMAGVLFARSYFDGPDAGEAEIRELANALFRRVEWPWFQTDEQGITMAWRPEPDRGFGRARWRGYDESILLHVLALGSPTHPAGVEIWDHYTSSYEWGELHGQELLQFAPLFGHQYSHVWIDFRGIQDDFMRERGIDYFENSRRATLAQRAYAIANPGGWRGYDEDVWGLTACDGPLGATLVIDGRERRFHTYWARGVAAGDVRDDGTVAPTAAGGSVPFAPEVTIAALRAMSERYGGRLYGRYGFFDAFNPTLTVETPTRHGAVVPGVGWFDDEVLGIDQGPILLMIENHRSGLIWEIMQDDPYVVRGLCRAGFRGGWLEGRCT